jgi:hypothetical protein
VIPPRHEEDSVTHRPKAMLRGLVLGIVCALSAACAGTPSKSQDTPLKTYDAPFDKVYSAAVIAFQNLDLEIFKQDQTAGYVEGGRRPAFGQGAETVGVFIERTSPTTTTVSIDNRKALAGVVFAVNWTSKLFDQIDRQLKGK